MLSGTLNLWIRAFWTAQSPTELQSVGEIICRAKNKKGSTNVPGRINETDVQDMWSVARRFFINVFMYFWIHLFENCLLNTYYVSCILLDFGYIWMRQCRYDRASWTFQERIKYSSFPTWPLFHWHLSLPDALQCSINPTDWGTSLAEPWQGIVCILTCSLLFCSHPFCCAVINISWVCS